HGKTAREAIALLKYNMKSFYDRGLHEIFIVHGKGQGILRENVRAYVRNLPYVKGYRQGGRSEGGNGVTVVIFKN
ncbi:MAG TPA: hypothetical protein ENL19_00980, partial [candidate division WOR-3 bacterium]|nr:hypothetical protein [candidate division WOR-3 bacterium]